MAILVVPAYGLMANKERNLHGIFRQRLSEMPPKGIRAVILHHVTYRRLGVEAWEDLQLVCRKGHFKIESEKGGG